MKTENYMKINFLSLSQNETFARTVISAFCLPLNPSLSELNEIKTAVSEAVTNAVVHGYPDGAGEIEMSAQTSDNKLHIEVSDKGIGIENLSQAMEPFYTTKPDEERSGMGFTVMQTFMEDVEIISEPNKGTKVIMNKTITLK